MIESEGTAENYSKGDSGWILGKGSSPKGSGALEQPPQIHGTELSGFEKHLYNALDIQSDFWVILCRFNDLCESL